LFSLLKTGKMGALHFPVVSIRKMQKNIPSISLFLRQKWIFSLGGLPNPSVRNSEWLDMLEEETRNTLMIEGTFPSKAQLKAALSEDPKRQKSVPEIIGVFEASNFAYEWAYQQFLEKEFQIPKSFIRAVQSTLFKPVPDYPYERGVLRQGNNIINGAKFKTPDYTRVSELLDKVTWLAQKNKKMTPWRRAAVFHAFFEHIHPFSDGNGRVGRILANCILLAHGFPNISLKFEEKGSYIKALEGTDKAIDDVFTGKIAWTKFPLKVIEELENIFLDRLAHLMDELIAKRWEMQGKKLIPLREIADQLGRNTASLQISAYQKKIIAVQKKGKWFSHPDFLKNPI